MTGLFITDCASTDWAWMDPGCLLQNAGNAVGGTITNVLQPVWIILGIVVLLVILVLFAPNVKHIAPTIGKIL